MLRTPSNCETVFCSTEINGFKDSEFGAVVASAESALSAAALAEVLRVLTPGGHFVFTVRALTAPTTGCHSRSNRVFVQGPATERDLVLAGFTDGKTATSGSKAQVPHAGQSGKHLASINALLIASRTRGDRRGASARRPRCA